MEIKSLSAINIGIKNNIFRSLIALLLLSLIILNSIYYKYLINLEAQHRNDIISNFTLLKSHLSEKISILGSSNAFIDYLRSGISHKKHY